MTNAQLLNVDDVLERLDGDKMLCANIFREFIKSYQNFDSEFRNFLEQENWSCAARAAHRLKGVALNIGAQELAGCASDLERELLDEQQATSLIRLTNLIPDTFAALDRTADRLTQEIREGLFSDDPNADNILADHLPPAAVMNQLAEAKSWFDTDYGKALRLIEELAPQCDATEYPEVHQLLELMKLFDILSARQALHQMVH